MTAPTPDSGVVEHAADGSTFLRAVPPPTPTNAPAPPEPGSQFGNVELPSDGNSAGGSPVTA